MSISCEVYGPSKRRARELSTRLDLLRNKDLTTVRKIACKFALTTAWGIAHTRIQRRPIGLADGSRSGSCPFRRFQHVDRRPAPRTGDQPAQTKRPWTAERDGHVAGVHLADDRGHLHLGPDRRQGGCRVAVRLHSRHARDRPDGLDLGSVHPPGHLCRDLLQVHHPVAGPAGRLRRGDAAHVRLCPAESTEYESVRRLRRRSAPHRLRNLGPVVAADDRGRRRSGSPRLVLGAHVDAVRHRVPRRRGGGRRCSVGAHRHSGRRLGSGTRSVPAEPFVRWCRRARAGIRVHRPGVLRLRVLLDGGRGGPQPAPQPADRARSGRS